ncbi:DUF4278 domain-containing protein [Gloeothece verrucosa]|uniref:DUF4278 domain-containing protein n=1 Tax=Gloeothece verrucosa (strain PCC 7822) TaxID=497965 RepID=E0UJ85_GLOV7|nr:DUF4278 domain-containing protein [Gloeothece verrucosa]ADN15788.1 conserved hypothetical protein [Gloeothece verrucosa PCC 7822]
MKLTYRGVNYEPEPATVEYYQGEIGGQYRGQDWHYRYPKHIPQLRPKLYRQYRGVSYSTRPVPYAENPVQESTTGGNCCPLTHQKPRRVYVDQTALVHLDNIRRNLERRLAVAKAKGDETLISLLEQESQQLAFKN